MRALGMVARGLAFAARSAALAICLAPLAVLVLRPAVGLDALRPWRDWTCGLPLSVFVDVCPRHEGLAASAPPFPWGFAAQTLAGGGLALLAMLAYLRPLASVAWLLAVGCGALSILLMTALPLMQPGRRDGDPAPPWMDNSLGMLLVLFAAAVAIQIGRLARRSARPGRQRRPGTQGQDGALVPLTPSAAATG